MPLKFINDHELYNIADAVRDVFGINRKLSINNMINVIKTEDIEFNTSNFNSGLMLVANYYGDPTDMSNAYNGQTTLKGVPFIGNKVVNMTNAYRNCHNLIGPPACGENVTDMALAYINCFNMTGDPKVGSNVVNMESAYENCRNLENNVMFGSNVTQASWAYAGTVFNSNRPFNYINSHGGIDNITNMSFCFYNINVKAYKTRSLSYMHTVRVGSQVGNLYQAFGFSRNINNVIDIRNTANYCHAFEHSHVAAFTSTNTFLRDMTYAFAEGRLINNYFYGIGHNSILNAQGVYCRAHSYNSFNPEQNIYSVGSLNYNCQCGSNVTDMSEAYENCNITSNAVIGVNVINMCRAFKNARFFNSQEIYTTGTVKVNNYYADFGRNVMCADEAYYGAQNIVKTQHSEFSMKIGSTYNMAFAYMPDFNPNSVNIYSGVSSIQGLLTGSLNARNTVVVFNYDWKTYNDGNLFEYVNYRTGKISIYNLCNAVRQKLKPTPDINIIVPLDTSTSYGTYATYADNYFKNLCFEDVNGFFNGDLGICFVSSGSEMYNIYNTLFNASSYLMTNMLANYFFYSSSASSIDIQVTGCTVKSQSISKIIWGTGSGSTKSSNKAITNMTFQLNIGRDVNYIVKSISTGQQLSSGKLSYPNYTVTIPCNISIWH